RRQRKGALVLVLELGGEQLAQRGVREHLASLIGTGLQDAHTMRRPDCPPHECGFSYPGRPFEDENAPSSRPQAGDELAEDRALSLPPEQREIVARAVPLATMHAVSPAPADHESAKSRTNGLEVNTATLGRATAPPAVGLRRQQSSQPPRRDSQPDQAHR